MIESNITAALARALEALGIEHAEPFEVEVPKMAEHGDYATNVAMKLAKPLRRAPLSIAEDIVQKMDGTIAGVSRIDVLRPGFINFHVDKTIFCDIIPEIIKQGSRYGSPQNNVAGSVNIEFVSANPTGSLHIGHARGAACGDTLARIMKKAGYDVVREFYVNDAGNQMTNLAQSIEVRYKELFDLHAPMPEDGYHGQEIIKIAERVKAQYGTRYLHEDGFDVFRAVGLETLMDGLRKDLTSFGVAFDVWFNESTLYENGDVEKTLDLLKTNGHTYEKDGAVWLATSRFGDEKDRVIVKSDGSYTYLLPDVAYHKNKLDRGFTKMIDILGSDHHGYVPRLKAAIQMVGGAPDALDVELLQMVRVIRDNVEVKMSKRSGKAITLADLIDEVGSDPIRYFFAMRSLNTHMDLDLDLAIKESNENPVYYAQYAHARIASLMRMAREKNIEPDYSVSAFSTLKSEKALILPMILSEYPNVIESAAAQRFPHRLAQYVQRLAQALHAFYASETILTDDFDATHERLTLLQAVKIVLKDALTLLGVDAKERM